jgi:hypothetical protein
MNTQHDKQHRLIPRIIFAPFFYTIGFFKAAWVPVNSDESTAK